MFCSTNISKPKVFREDEEKQMLTFGTTRCFGLYSIYNIRKANTTHLTQTSVYLKIMGLFIHMK